MHRALLCSLLIVGTAACGGGEDTSSEDDKDDEVYGPPLIDGNISVEWRNNLPVQEGKIMIRKAFGFAAQGSGVLYLSSFGEATCEDVAEGLNSKGRFDPAKVFKSGYCNLSLGFKFDNEAGLDGTSHTDDPLNALWSVTCPFGYEDTWDYGTNDLGDKGYWWSGNLWQGDPNTATVAFAGNATEVFNVDLNLNGYTGSFIYDDLGDFPGTGSLVGAFDIELCADLTQTPIWPQ
jgi:hypothetical protein